MPIDLDTYIKKLAISRRRILLVNDILQNVQVQESVDTSILWILPCIALYLDKEAMHAGLHLQGGEGGRGKLPLLNPRLPPLLEYLKNNSNYTKPAL